ncbi:hypothetical protein VCHC59B1_3384B, partial [Vibrio cholerae HC-59B1]|jgi:hypothetical protein
LFL